MKTLLIFVFLSLFATPSHAEAITIGGGTNFYYDTPSLGRPFGPNAQRYQILLYAEDLSATAGSTLAGLEFDGELFRANQATFYNVAIYVCPTTKSVLTPRFAENYDDNKPTLVFQRDELPMDWADRSWYPLMFDTEFALTPGRNLVIEFRHDGSDGGTFRTTRWNHEAGRILDGVGHMSSGRDVGAGYLRNYLNGLRLLVTPPEDEAEQRKAQ